MDEKLKRLMQDLGNAIDESLSDNERIGEAMDAIKHAGYDVFLVLEATIGFSRRDEEGPTEGEIPLVNENVQPQVDVTGKVRFTTQDQRFAKALRIDLGKD